MTDPIDRMCDAHGWVGPRSEQRQRMRKALLALSETVPAEMVDVIDRELEKARKQENTLNLDHYDDDERFSILVGALSASLKAMATAHD